MENKAVKAQFTLQALSESFELRNRPDNTSYWALKTDSNYFWFLSELLDSLHGNEYESSDYLVKCLQEYIELAYVTYCLDESLEDNLETVFIVSLIYNEQLIEWSATFYPEINEYLNKNNFQGFKSYFDLLSKANLFHCGKMKTIIDDLLIQYL